MESFYYDYFSERTNTLKAGGNYRTFLTLQKSATTFPVIEFLDTDEVVHTAVNWCSNDYMNMSVSDVVICRAQEIITESGLGSGGTRNISGTTLHHRQLEKAIAHLHHKESALVFNGAFLANQTTLATLGITFDNAVFLSDERNHASIITGMQASKRTKLIFKHNSADHLRQLLQALPLEQPKIIVCESVYSMTGSIAPLSAFADLAQKYNALLYVDEVHAVGVYGTQGEGLAGEQGCEAGIHVINGTLAKAFGTLGGYIAANHTITEFVRSFAPGFIFTTSLPPALCAASVASIEYITANEQLRPTYHHHVARLRYFLRERRIPFEENPSHITPVLIGDTERCKALSHKLLYQYGIYVQPINYPTVRRGEECLRLTLTLRHTEEQMQYLADSLAAVLFTAL
jgi:5-aminolevulinate synthase